MGTIRQSSFELGLRIPLPEKKRFDTCWREPDRPKWNEGPSTQHGVLREILQTESAPPDKSHTCLNAIWKSASESVSVTASMARGRASKNAELIGNAKIILENLPVLRQALAESKAAIQNAHLLPQIEIPEFSSSIPRSFALASAYLRIAEFDFDLQDLVQFVEVAQKHTPLEMSEIWNLKSFLELALLEQIAREVGRNAIPPKQGETSQYRKSGGNPRRLTSLLGSLAHLFNVEWKAFFERASSTEQILRSDPARAYADMDFDTRESYRAAVAALAAHSNYTESEVARSAICLCQMAQKSNFSDQKARERRTHVGYYLVDEGQDVLKTKIAYRPRLSERARDFVIRWPDFSYFLGIELIACTLIAVLISFLHLEHTSLFAVVLFVLPALECAVAMVNTVVTRMLAPRKIPKLDFSSGIPSSRTTVVAVPALLTSEKQVRQAVKGIEVRFLANRDPNLHFVLLTDLPDSTQQFDEKEPIVGLCSRLLQELDDKYRRDNKGRLFHFHRYRVYDSEENLWMGWERKRGKLLDFNSFLLHREDRFPVKTGETALLKNVRYVITLDLDTQLPPGIGQRLVGAMAHPLNRPVIDPAKNMVTEGYGILQPRVDISVKSATRSRFASLLSGDTGFDIYTRAVSDIYQDLFGEGIFTGKGVYEVETFQEVLEHRFPRNRVLSHDLIEGVYARTGLVSDVEVVDDYPSHFSAFSRRKHRWVRGDWQIVFSLFPWVRNGFGEETRNPLSRISRWKIFDNLRRSLAEFATLLMFLYGWLLLPGNALRWTLAAVMVMLIPACFQFLLTAFTGGKAWFRADFWRNLWADCALALARFCVRLAFLCHQSLIDLDAVVRALVRMKFTHRRLLEWETAADAELSDGNSDLVDDYLKYSLLLTVAIGPLVYALHPHSLGIAMPFVVLWAASAWIGEWLNRPQNPAKIRLKMKDRELIRNAALRTWRFFREFSNPAENWLIPDIVQETPPLVAHRISPTNLGLLLNARLAAHDLGYLTAQEFIELTEKTFETIKRMPKCKGHLFNWYETSSLEPVPPLFVSTVDNGNLVCSLWTLKQGCLEMVRKPLLPSALWAGLRDHAALLAEVVLQNCDGNGLVPAAIELRQAAEEIASETEIRMDELRTFEVDALIFHNRASKNNPNGEVTWWAKDLSLRAANLLNALETFAPWLEAQFEGTSPLPKSEITRLTKTLTLESIPRVYGEICASLDDRTETPEALAGSRRLSAALERSMRLCEDFAGSLASLASAAHSLVDQMDFNLLYDAKKKLFSIGYDAGENAISKYNYDLLASEARTAVFVAVAKGEAPQESWFHLKRTFRSSFREEVLLSWTGTAFEYLMPCLWVRAYPNTLLDRSVRAAIRTQQKFARENGIPWGISESSCAERNSDGHYRYHAFGVSGLAVHRDDCSGDLVVAPYATFLGMMFDLEGAVANLRKMKDLGWLSRFGYYEAADFTPRRDSAESGHTVVRNWMAHHQGMSLVAAVNILCDSPMHRRFHAEPRVAAMERLLHEKMPRALPHANDAEANAEPGSELAGLSVQMPRPDFRNLVPKFHEL
jgi:cyclic beta-1,2-glucan synthetase